MHPRRSAVWPVRGRAGHANSVGLRSTIAVFANQIDGSAAVGLLCSSERGGPSEELLTTPARALGEDATRLLFERYALEPCLYAQTLDNEVVEVPNQNRGHGASVRCYR
jgi:hypothetical protein